MLHDGCPADVHVSLEGRRDLTGQIYRQLREAVLDGRLRRGELLPPSRELAGRLAVSRNTVTAAYDRLTAEGFISGRVGAGTFVTAEPHPARRPGAVPPGPLRPRCRLGRDSRRTRTRRELALRLPHRDAGRAALPVPAVARPDRAGAAGERGRHGRVRGSGRPRRAARGDRPARRGRPRGARHGRRRPRHQRHAAGARSCWPGCCSSRAASSRSKIPATRRRATCSGRSACGSSGCRWTPRGSVVDAIPAAAGWST